MIPKIDFQIHKLLLNMFLRPNLPEKHEYFKQKADKFISFIRDKETEILGAIPQKSGNEWKKEKIPVYLIPWSSLISYAKPILEDGFSGIVQTVGTGEIFERDIHIFIHELVHVNQFQAGVEKDKDQIELEADLVCLYVIRSIFGESSEYEKDFWKFLTETNEKNKQKYDNIMKVIKECDLNKKSFKEYCEAGMGI